MCVYVHLWTCAHICVALAFILWRFHSLPQTQFGLATLNLGTLKSPGLDLLSLEGMRNESRVHFMKTMQAHSREIKI